MFWRHERYGTKTSRGGVHKKACHRLISSTGFAPWACSARRPRKGIRKLRLSSPTCFAVEKLASRTRKKRRGLWLRYGTVRYGTRSWIQRFPTFSLHNFVSSGFGYWQS